MIKLPVVPVTAALLADDTPALPLDAPALGSSDAYALAKLDVDALQRMVRERAEAAWRLACEVHPGLPQPRVWFDLRGRSAGQAHYQRGGLRFNPTLLNDNRQAFMDDIVAHEMAHWLIFHLDGGLAMRPHGREWKTVMRRLYGLAPTTTHHFDVSRASPMPYRYHCHCQAPHYLSARRHARVAKGARYRCRRCHGELIFETVESPA